MEKSSRCDKGGKAAKYLKPTNFKHLTEVMLW
jgi:hypothetical protein